MNFILFVFFLLSVGCGSSNNPSQEGDQFIPDGPDTKKIELVRDRCLESEQVQSDLNDSTSAELLESETTLEKLQAVRGAGERSGSFDVVSILKDQQLVFRLSKILCDGEGVDFSVFENAFRHDYGVFQEPAVVSVSHDGENFYDFPYGVQEESLFGFAGLNPVIFDSKKKASAFGKKAGGDSFDLSIISKLSPISKADVEKGIRFIRIISFDPELHCLGEKKQICQNELLSDFIGSADIDGLVTRYQLSE